jgi:hypothetical protein
MEYDPKSPSFNKNVTEQMITEDNRLLSVNTDLQNASDHFYNNNNSFYSEITAKRSIECATPTSPYETALDFSILYKNKHLLKEKVRLQFSDTLDSYKKTLDEINAIQIAAYELFIKVNHDPILFDRYSCILEGRHRLGDINPEFKSIDEIRNTIKRIKGDFFLDDKGRSTYIAKRVSFLLKGSANNQVLSPENMPTQHVFASQALCEKFNFSGLKYRFFYESPEIWNNSHETFLEREIINANYIYNPLLSGDEVMYTQAQYESISEHDDFLRVLFSGDAFIINPFGRSIFTVNGVR